MSLFQTRLSVIGLAGYTGKITGGSDKNGFPMNPSLPGATRKKIFFGKGVGLKSKRKGLRVRKTVRGKLIAEDIHQVNVSVVKAGSKALADIFKKEEKAEAKPEEGKAEAPAEKKEAKPAEKKEEKPKEEKPQEEKPQEEKPQAEKPQEEKAEGKKE
jgi:small subunit ribosomal protein S6e